MGDIVRCRGCGCWVYVAKMSREELDANLREALSQADGVEGSDGSDNEMVLCVRCRHLSSRRSSDDVNKGEPSISN